MLNQNTRKEMTHEQFMEKLESIPNIELAEKSQSILSKLCARGGSGFTMSVPPKLSDDDIILSEVIRRFKAMHSEAVANLIQEVKTEINNL